MGIYKNNFCSDFLLHEKRRPKKKTQLITPLFSKILHVISRMPSDTLFKFSSQAEKTATKMPLVTLDPNKPKLLTATNSVRSPNKRTTPPQSPPTPHKIELVEDETRRKLRSSQSNGVSSNDSETASTSSDDGIRFVRTSSVKKTLFQNGSSPAKAIRTSPRKVEAQEKTTDSTNQVVPTSLNNNKGPKKKLSFVDNDKPTNGSVKSFMPIRRSERRREKKNQTSDIIQKLKEVDNDDSVLPLKVVEFPGKNRGIVTTIKLSKGDFVVEYSGELIEHTTAEERENKYAMDVSKGCYMYYFIDATVETGRYGRLVNHSRLHPNLMTKVIMNGKSPRLILIAKHDLEPGTELLYDYGDRSKESLAAHPWLAK